VVKPVFATLERALIILKLGTISAGDGTALRKAIGEILGWPPDADARIIVT
jgi:hypothetical protein